MKTLLLITLFSVVRPPATTPPFAYDPNFCQGEVMDWAFSEPNVSVVYAVRFHTLSGRATGGLDVTLGSGQIISVSVLYEGRVKDPNGPGWFHEWRFGYTPRFAGVHHLNIKAWYGKRSHSLAWLIPPGPLESDTRTILLNAIVGDIPFLMPGTTPGPIVMKRGQRLWQHAKAVGKPLTNPTIVWR